MGTCQELQIEVPVVSELTLLSEELLFQSFLMHVFNCLKLFWLVVTVTLALFCMDNSDSTRNSMFFKYA